MNNFINPKERLPEELDRVVIKLVNHCEDRDIILIRPGFYYRNGGKPTFVACASAIEIEDVIGWIPDDEYKAEYQQNTESTIAERLYL